MRSPVARSEGEAQAPPATEERPYGPASHARRWPDKPAIVMSGSGRVVTYADLDRRSNRLLRLLRDAGCRSGDHVALVMENHPNMAEVCWAAYRGGLHFTPVNWHLTPDEAAYIVRDCGASVVVASQGCLPTAADLPARCPQVRRHLMVPAALPGPGGADAPDGYEPYEDALAGFGDEPLGTETEGAAMLYSSGTTGRPKGVARPLSGRVPGTTIFGIDPAVASTYGMDASTVTLVPVPMYHSMGLTRLMMCTAVGATVVAMERFTAEAALAAIDRHGITMASWVPTMLIRLLRLDPAVRARYDLSSMVISNIGSGPCPSWVKPAVIDWWGPIITETYGGTEGMGMTSISALEMLERPASVGRAVFGELHIVRDDGTEAAPGETGVIYFAGGRPFEYHNDPQKTKEARDARGWATLGDIGHVDGDGYLYITDRAADVIVSGAVNIYPREVEDVLLGHPEVEDVAVIGVPNEEYGEEVKALVKPVGGATGDEGLAHRLAQHCRGSLAGYKCPRSFDFVDALPRQATGKLAKRLLREPYWAGRQTRVV